MKEKHQHIHVKCGFCEWEKCPADLEPMTVAGFYLIHVIDDHWDLVERIHGTTGDTAARRQLIVQIATEMT